MEGAVQGGLSRRVQSGEEDDPPGVVGNATDSHILLSVGDQVRGAARIALPEVGSLLCVSGTWTSGDKTRSCYEQINTAAWILRLRLKAINICSWKTKEQRAKSKERRM